MSDAERLGEEAVAEFEREAHRIRDQLVGEMRRTEFIDRLACALWVAWDPISRARDPGLTAEGMKNHLDGRARECVREAERLWRVRNEEPTT